MAIIAWIIRIYPGQYVPRNGYIKPYPNCQKETSTRTNSAFNQIYKLYSKYPFPSQATKMYLTPTIPLLLTLLLPLTSTTPLTRRDASTVIADLNTISADIADFDAAVSVFDGTLAEALAIQVKETKIEDDIQIAIEHTQSSAAFTTAESTDVTNTLLDLKPEILSSIDLVVSKVCV